MFQCPDCGASVCKVGRRCLTCAGIHRRKPIQVAPCAECGQEVRIEGRWAREQWRTLHQVFCSKACSYQHRGHKAAAVMAETNRRYAGARMRARNPMRNAETRRKVSETLRTIRHRPPVQGGNGRPTPRPVTMLQAALGWPVEVAIPTRRPRGSGYPSSYKVDLADRMTRVAIEVDGPSHGPLAAKARDAKKDALLAGLGWTVLRFTNAEVEGNLAGCVETVMSTISALPASRPTQPTA